LTEPAAIASISIVADHRFGFVARRARLLTAPSSSSNPVLMVPERRCLRNVNGLLDWAPGTATDERPSKHNVGVGGEDPPWLPRAR